MKHFTITYHSLNTPTKPISFRDTHVGYLKQESYSGDWFFDLYDSGENINSPAFKTQIEARRWAYLEFPRFFGEIF